MRTLVFALSLMLAFLTFSATTATAQPSVCQTESVDATLVNAEVTYGGIGCLDASVERCTLEYDPEYPSYPYWVCHEVIGTP